MLVLLAALVAVKAYIQVIDAPFFGEDARFVAYNTMLTNLKLVEFWRLFAEPHNSSFEYLPLRDFSFWLDITLFGSNPIAFRSHNILLYLLSLPLLHGATFRLWCYFRPLDTASAPWVAALVTALFAIHPALVEPVVWISGRKYVLPNLFAALTFWLATRTKSLHGLSNQYACATLIAFVAVMFAKSSYVAMALVVAILWIIYWLDTPSIKRSKLQLLWPIAIMTIAMLLLANFISFNKGHDSAPPYWGIEAAGRSFAAQGWLARLAFSPENRHFYYPVFEDASFPVMIVVGIAVFIGAAWGLVAVLCKRSLEGFVVLIFAVLCIPYLQIRPTIPPSLVSDRYVALSAWAAMFFLVTLAWRLTPRKRKTLLILFAMPMIFQTFSRSRDWRSSEAMIEAEYLAYPGYYMPAYQKIMGLQLPQGLSLDAAEVAKNVTIPEIRQVLDGLIRSDFALRDSVRLSSNFQGVMSLMIHLGDILKHPPVQVRWNPSMLYVWKRLESSLAQQWHTFSLSFPENELIHYKAGLYLLSISQNANAVSHLRAAIDSQRLPERLRVIAENEIKVVSVGSARMH